MKEEKKKLSGYAILKAKLVKKDAEIAELKNRLSESNVLQLEQDMAFWKSRCHSLEDKVKYLLTSLDTAISQMGWLRRLIYHY
jgi:hypothetical protein